MRIHPHYHSDFSPALLRKLPLELLSAVICLVVLHAAGVNLMSVHRQTNGSYLALACIGCILAMLAVFYNETNARRLQSAGFMLANLIAILCFY